MWRVGWAILRRGSWLCGTIVVLGWLLSQFDQHTARVPVPTDLHASLPVPPPNWSSHVTAERGNRGLLTARQRIGGAFVSSPIPDPDQDRHVAWGRRNPFPLPENHPGQGLYLLVSPFSGSGLQDNFPRTEVAIVNATSQLLEFHSIEGTLPIIQEARDPAGNWRAIEYFPRDLDESNLVRVYLPPRHYWQSVVRCYTGDFPTVCRLALWLPGGEVLYSAEYEQSVSLGQFIPAE